MTRSSSYYYADAAGKPVVVSKRSRASSVHDPSDPCFACIAGITGITAASRLPLLPLAKSQPVSDENFTTHGNTTVKTRRPSGPSGATSPSTSSSRQLSISIPVKTTFEGSKPRRFFPQPVESSKRVRESGRSGPTIRLHEKTYSSLSRAPSGARKSPSQSLKSPHVANGLSVPLVGESQFLSSVLEETESRQHSFGKSPELSPFHATRDKACDDSSCPSTFISPTKASADNVLLGEAIQPPISGRGKTQGPSFTPPTQALNSQLMEQAMAAYPNEKIHEPVDHFAVAREDESIEEGVHTDGNQTSLRRSEDVRNKPLDNDTPEPDTIEPSEDVQMEEMTSAAKPPLAGQELRFPRCQSPRQTLLDVGQLYQARKQACSDLVKRGGGLWTPGGGASRKGSAHGLWMGSSVRSNQDSRNVAQTGVLTPATDRDQIINFPTTPQTQTHGLWTGPSVKSNQNSRSIIQTGLLTPATDRDQIFNSPTSLQSQTHGLWMGSSVKPNQDSRSVAQTSPLTRATDRDQMFNSPTSLQSQTHGLWMGSSVKSKQNSRNVAQTDLLTPATNRDQIFNSPARPQNHTHGLWVGTSAKPDQDCRNVTQTSPLTPATDHDQIFRPPVTYPQNQLQLPPSPPGSDDECQMHCVVNSALSNEETIMGEFDDIFITQIYNYLSLGYPAMARKFDSEISKISKVSVEELRQHDSNANAKGFVGAPEGSGAAGNGKEGGGRGGTCARWGALRKYVHEWARQEGRFEGID